MMAPHVYGRFVYLSPIVFICGLLVRLLDSVAPLFFLLGLNKQFSPQLNGRNDLGMCPRGLFTASWCWSRLHHRASHTHKL